MEAPKSAVDKQPHAVPAADKAEEAAAAAPAPSHPSPVPRRRTNKPHLQAPKPAIPLSPGGADDGQPHAQADAQGGPEVGRDVADQEEEVLEVHLQACVS